MIGYSKKSLLPILVFFCNLLCAQVTYEVAFPNLDFDFTVEIQDAGDGSNRLFVVEQTGRIKVFPNSDTVSQAEQIIFLDISQEISYSSGQEIGLLGLAFHPNYAQNGYFFVYYTRASTLPGANTEIVLARFTVSGDPNISDPTTRTELFSFDKNQLDSNHNGGKIAFGPDGYLYISIGDGGGAGDPNDNAQNLQNVFGSMLRIDVDVDGNNPLETNANLPDGNYEIPSDNPRIGQEGLDELYAWGLRNTWKFSFDNQSGNLWGADVGQGEFEEINLISMGGNFGWDRFEATSISDSSTTLATDNDIEPVYFYDHNQGDVSITGGYVYRGSSTDSLLSGNYIYGDYVSGRVWSLAYDSASALATSTLLFRANGHFISSFGIDEAGELYFSDYGIGKKLYRISGGTADPIPVQVEGIGFWENLENGIAGVVNAVGTTRTNSIYVGGEFNNAGGMTANNLAVYNSDTGWNNFGTGTNGSVDAIVVGTDDNVYIGGSFTSVDGIAANNIAFWDGNQWSPLGEGTDGPVQVMQLDASNNLFVGGSFQNAGGLLVRNIAVWNTGEWSALSDETTGVQGTNNEVRSIAVGNGNRIYIGGNFDAAGGNSAPRIAVWDGNGWGTLGTGTSGFVQAILVTDDNIYVGGNFSLAGGQTVNRIARWSIQNSEWHPLGNGVSGNVNSLEYDGIYLYVGGSFETASETAETEKILHNIARWSSAIGWEALGSETEVGVSVQVKALAFDTDLLRLYVGGNFSNAGTIEANNVAIWYEEEPPIVIADDNFTIVGVDNDCPNSSNGSITVRANQPADYQLKLSVGSEVLLFEFTDTVEITGLPPADYEIDITAVGLSDYNANYQITIEAPAMLQVAAQYNDTPASVILNMSGGTMYTVDVNGNILRTAENNLTIDLVENATVLKVTTDTECQGIFEETFTLEGKEEGVVIEEEEEIVREEVNVIYPNPFNDEVTLNFSNGNDGDQIEVAVFTLSGVQLLSQLYMVQNSAIIIDTGILSDGMYLVRLQLGNTLKTIKLIKN